jgi:hypothetical protein
MGLLDKLQFWKRKEEESFDMGSYPALTERPAPPAMQGMDMPPGAMAGMHTGMPGENAPAMPGLDDMSQVPPPPMRGLGGQPAPSAFAPAPIQQPQGPDVGREMQVVNAKLDTLKALLDSVNMKLDRMERAQTPKEEVEIIPLQRRFR